ncbi:alanine or glycine:cation symporter, AGCS family [Saccharicrinis carchari]|uniref:Alanine or glycine:cation symporter, AGCS family n=1 Tax=Saccharicrinis carchari TaxID=1168039 RepID=A0A521C5E7_SACCC|nr:amino acid carrier protein [Saccharicrinis carchari]SMO54051.1 alanine or glycine:cation symporter, AGCS family [Saccharicrinis carchari]
MQKFNDMLLLIDSYIGSSAWFVYLLLGVGLFFTLYLGFPQLRYFRYALKIVRGKFDKEDDVGDTSHFQALATALSGTVGTGNIAGVAYAIFLGGPAALFWMLVTALIGMTTKFVEVTLSHKYRGKAEDGTISGGPMYYMKRRLNIKLPSGKLLKTGKIMAILFAVATVLSSFGTGNLPQINSIANAINTTFGIPHILTGLILSILLGTIIIGGIKRIALVTSRLVPTMAVIYFIGALAVILYNYQNVIPSLVAVFADVFTGTAATGGFLGASIAFAFNRGVNRGLFSNEAGQGSAPIAHSSARAHEPVSEGLVALLEPFIDTIIICSVTGITLLASGVWSQKHQNEFQRADLQFLTGIYNDQSSIEKAKLGKHVNRLNTLPLFTGELKVNEGKIMDEVSLIHARSLAEQVKVFSGQQLYSGSLTVDNGIVRAEGKIRFVGKSLIHSAPLTTLAFTRSWFGDFGKYIVSIGLLLFAFSTAITWSYYGGRAIIFLVGIKGLKYYRLVYVLAFFFASFTDTTIIWTFSGITIALMSIPNLIGIFSLHKEMKMEVKKFWVEYGKRFPNEKLPLLERNKQK